MHTKVKVPTWFTNEARTLVRGLLTKEANQRLGVDPDSPTHASDMTSLKVRGTDPRFGRFPAHDTPDPALTLPHPLPIQAHPFFKGVNWQMLMLRKLEPPYVPQLADADDRGDSGTLDVSHFDKKYTLEPPIMSPPRRPLSASMEAQFEALELEYMSPETRNSVRDSMRSTARSTGRSSGRSSGRSTSGTQSGGGESLLRFAERQPKK